MDAVNLVLWCHQSRSECEGRGRVFTG